MIINCIYSGNCLSFNERCSSCSNNKNAKQDHYSPIQPYYPYPYTPPWTYPIIWYTTDGNSKNITITGTITASNNDHYVKKESE